MSGIVVRYISFLQNRMEQSQPDLTQEFSKPRPRLNWRLIRKVEGLVFASMLLAIPFFAFRIVDATGTALMVKNTSVDLVKDLIKARDMAKDFKLPITVTCARGVNNEPFAYLIQNGSRTIEQVIVPPGVSMVGSVTFDETGIPKGRSSFVITKGMRSATVEVDERGSTSVRDIPL
jgi:hypothetical protein